jgi:hypothetical protein
MSRNNKVEPRLRLLSITFFAFLMVAFAIFAVQTWRYSGIARWLGEWQFGLLRVYFPMSTALALGLLSALPIGLIFMIMRMRETRSVSDPVDPQTEMADRIAAIRRRNWRYIVFVQAVAGFAFVGAIIFGMKLLALQEAAAQGPVISADQPVALDSGPVRIAGRIDSRHVVRLDQQQALFRRDLFIAPLLGQSGGAVQYFAEVQPIGTTLEPASTPFSGQISAEAFPKEAISLFEGAGVRVAPNARIIFQSSGSLGWPYRAAASQFLAIGFFALLFAALLRWRRRRLETWL